MLAGKQEIAAVIPHANTMCLLDGVLEYSAQRICCVSGTHRDTGNPMRSGNELHALCGIEYAAQAMAVHGAWSGQADTRPRAGYLASLRDVCCRKIRLDDLNDDLIIEAEKLLGDSVHVIYQFTIRAGNEEIMSGRATVVLSMDEATA